MAVVDPRSEAPRFNRGVRSRIAANVVLVSVLAVVLVAFVNYGMSEYATGHDVRYDLTATQWHRLEDSTKSLLRAADEPIEIYLVHGFDEAVYQAARPDLSAQRADSGILKDVYRPVIGYMAGGVTRMANEARHVSSRITFHAADALQVVDEPREWARRLGLGPNQLINHVVFFNPRTRARQAISLYKLFDFDIGGPDPTRGHQPPTVRGDYLEQHLVHGIKTVLDHERRRVCIAVGHQEIEVPGAQVFLEGDNFDVEALNMASETRVPEDCALLIIPSPARAWTDAAREALVRYVDGGGRVMLSQGRGCREPFTELLDPFGVRMLSVQVSHPKNNLGTEGPYSLYGVDLVRPSGGSPHPITAPTVRDRLPVYLGFSRGYEVTADYDQSRITRSVLAHSGAGGVAMPWIHDGRDWRQAPERGTESGDFPLAIAAARRGTGGSSDARLVVIGSDAVFSSRWLTTGYNTANTDLLLNSAYWLTDRDKLITGTPRAFRGRLAALDDGQRRTLRVLFVWVVPALIFSIGLLVFLVRRR